MDVRDLIVSPGGYRPKSSVHRIDEQSSLIIDPRTGQEKPVCPGDQLPGQAPPVPRWIAFAHWTNDTQRTINLFTTEWIVPPAPDTQSQPLQTIYLFCGLENKDATGQGILQPVLQWGGEGEGNGPFWSVASYYASSNGHVCCSKQTRVNVGEKLTGVITLVESSKAGFSYDCEFKGMPHSRISIVDVAELLWCCEALEAYGTTQCSDYPATLKTSMTNISIRSHQGTLAPNWVCQNQIIDCNQHVVVVNSAEIDLYYSGG
jgi:hypothetical protein